MRAAAKSGNHFVLTEHGYEKTPCHVRGERRVGLPVKGFEFTCPASWIKKGYVKETRI